MWKCFSIFVSCIGSDSSDSIIKQTLDSYRTIYMIRSWASLNTPMIMTIS